MERNSTGKPARGGAGKPERSRAVSIFTDIHFWVPAAVLLGGLLLLRFIH